MRRLIITAYIFTILWDISWGQTPHNQEGLSKNNDSNTQQSTAHPQGQILAFQNNAMQNTGNQISLSQYQVPLQSAGSALTNYYQPYQTQPNQVPSFSTYNVDTSQIQTPYATQVYGLYTAAPLQLQYNQPLNQYFHQLPAAQTNLNPIAFANTQTPVQQNAAPAITPDIGKYFKDSIQFKTTPLFYSQVHHPLHTKVQLPQQYITPKQQQHNAPQPYQYNVPQPQQYNAPKPQFTHKPALSPPTPPKIYRNFHPITPQNIRQPAPVTEPAPPAQSEEAENVEDNSENEEQNQEQNAESDEEDNENYQEEDDENSSYKEEENIDDDFPPKNFRFASKFRDDDNDDNDNRHRHSYRHRDNDEDDDHRSESYKLSVRHPNPSKLTSKFQIPKEIYSNSFNAKDYNDYRKTGNYESPFDSFTGPNREGNNPKVQIKMYKYTMSSNQPERREFIEGKESEVVPVIQQSQKSYKEEWIIESESSSDETK